MISQVPLIKYFSIKFLADITLRTQQLNAVEFKGPSQATTGVLILVYCTYKLNDKIAVGGFEGLVTKINLRYTTLKTAEASVLIPNATVFSSPVKILRAEDECPEEDLAAGAS